LQFSIYYTCIIQNDGRKRKIYLLCIYRRTLINTFLINVQCGYLTQKYKRRSTLTTIFIDVSEYQIIIIMLKKFYLQQSKLYTLKFRICTSSDFSIAFFPPVHSFINIILSTTTFPLFTRF
jgi:hypothetical protein